MSKSWFVRCFGCGKQYLYRHGSVASKFADKYCPDCCAYLDEALSKIRPVYESRWKEISFGEKLEFDGVDDMRRRIDSLHNNEPCEYGFNFEPVEFVPSGMKTGDVLIYSSKKYALCKDDNGLEHVFVWWEYDTVKGEFGSLPWLVDGMDKTYPLRETMFVEASSVETTELLKPEGKLYWVELLSRHDTNYEMTMPTEPINGMLTEC